MARVMAIDYGRKRIGMAATDETQLSITPLEQIEFNKKNSWDSICYTIKKYSPEKIVIGMPEGEYESSLRREIIEFRRHLEKLLPDIEMSFFDESYSSKEAGLIWHEKYADAKANIHKKKKKLDSIAAAVILRRYLERV